MIVDTLYVSLSPSFRAIRNTPPICRLTLTNLFLLHQKCQLRLIFFFFGCCLVGSQDLEKWSYRCNCSCSVRFAAFCSRRYKTTANDCSMLYTVFGFKVTNGSQSCKNFTNIIIIFLIFARILFFNYVSIDCKYERKIILDTFFRNYSYYKCISSCNCSRNQTAKSTNCNNCNFKPLHFTHLQLQPNTHQVYWLYQNLILQSLEP